MERERINVVYFHNGSWGGVWSVIKNLIVNTDLSGFRLHLIFTVEKNEEFVLPEISGEVIVNIFRYSKKWNFFYICKKLAQLIPQEKCVLVANDWLELGLVSHLKLNKRVIYILHGDYHYYYQLAHLHKPNIDSFVCVSNAIYANLKTFQYRNTFNWRFPVQNSCSQTQFTALPPLKLFYGVQSIMDENKQFVFFAQVIKEIDKRRLPVVITIVGKDMREDDVVKMKRMSIQVHYLRGLSNHEYLEVLSRNHVFILPSISEGLPVSLVEAMKSGVVPLIPRWNGAADELVSEGVTGFFMDKADVNLYVNKIEFLIHHLPHLCEISKNAKQKADRLFDPQHNTRAFEAIIRKACDESRPKKYFKVYGSRLDHKCLPNFITTMCRSLNG